MRRSRNHRPDHDQPSTPGSPTGPLARVSRRGRWAVGAAVTALVLAGCSGGGSTPTSSDASSAPTTATSLPAPATIAGTIVTTAGSSNEMSLVVPEAVAAQWTGLTGDSGVEWVAVAGDGTTETTPVAFGGDTTQVTALTERADGDQSTAPGGRQALAGLDAVASPAGTPVWVFSPLLDTAGPMDMTQLAFDQSPPDVVAAVTAAGKLPDLTGRTVTFVVTPVAGQQQKLSDLQVGYQRAIWEDVARAAGAADVVFFDGTGTTPGTGTVPAVPVPDPNATIDAQGSGPTRTCTLPAPALFLPNTPQLIDRAATATALSDCIGSLQSATQITIQGHTAAVGAGDEQAAVDLSTQRATEVAAILREQGVPAENITSVVGLGSSQPIVQPASDPGNRAVVVTFTTTG